MTDWTDKVAVFLVALVWVPLAAAAFFVFWVTVDLVDKSFDAGASTLGIKASFGLLGLFLLLLSILLMSQEEIGRKIYIIIGFAAALGGSVADPNIISVVAIPLTVAILYLPIVMRWFHQTPMNDSTGVDRRAASGKENNRQWLVALVIVMIAANIANGLRYSLSSDIVRNVADGLPAWVIPGLTLGSLLKIAFALALYRHKLWGFWGFAAATIAMVGLDLVIGSPPVESLLGLLGVAILFGILRMGGKDRLWTQLS